MARMILEVEFKGGGFAELCGPDIKYWSGQGLPDYEGGLDGFAECYPMEWAELLRRRLVKRIAEDDSAPN